MKRTLLLLPAVALLLWSGVASADAASEAQLKNQLAQAQAELARYKDGFERANAALGQVQAEQRRTQANEAQAGKLLEYCQAKNVYVIALGQHILKQAQTKRPVSEPFTQLMRVRLENEQQEYEDKIRAGRFDPRLDHPVTEARAPAAAEASAPKSPAEQPAGQPAGQPDGGG